MFEVVGRIYDSFNDTWNKDYAGMFTEEDKAGRSIKGYDIVLPMQIMGNWSENFEDYFARIEHPTLHHVYSPSYGYYADIKYNHSAVIQNSPYFELDKAYAEMIKSDDLLTLNEKLELIIMNHKGYLKNIFPNIEDIILENYNSSKLDEIEDAYTNVEYLEFEDNILIGVKKSLLDNDIVNKFLIQTVASLEIIKYRLPVIAKNFESQKDKTNIILKDDKKNYRASQIIFRNVNKITIYPKLLEYSFEQYFNVFVHENIHYICKSDVLKNFNKSYDVALWLIRPSRNSELVTYGNSVFLGEVLNFSPSGMYDISGIDVWYKVYGDVYHDGEAPLENFVKIIDNKL